MITSNFNLENNILSIIKKDNFYFNISKKFNQIFSELKNELSNKNKTINILDKKFSLNFKISELQKFKKFKKIAIIGMGGSILGSEAIYNFLEKRVKKKIYFLNNINEKKIITLKKKEKLSEVLFIIISKSGNTIETISNALSLKIFKKKAKNIIIISEKKNSDLFNLAKKLKLKYIEHKKNIGGRYSVLSEVGIVPAYLMGLNISKLRSNLLNFFTGSEKLFLKDSSINLSSIFKNKKFNNIIFLNYYPELESFLFWLQQLLGESLGKKNKGFLPMISNVPKDHHSLLQLYLDGPKDKLFYIFSNEIKTQSKIKLKNSKLVSKSLNNKFLSQIKRAQKKALIKAFKIKKIPFRLFEIKKNNEMVLGSLFSYFILETIMIGKLNDVNPFDQPAVEQIKNLTKKFLS